MTEDGYVTISGTGTTQIYAVAKASDNFVRQVSDAITVTIEEDPKPQPKPSIRAIRIGGRPGLPYAATCRRCGGTKPHSLTIRDCYEFMNH